MSRNISHPALEDGLTFLASYPKSGNTWCRYLIKAYYHGRPDKFAFFDDVAPYPFQTSSPIPSHALTPEQQVQIRPAALLHLARMAGVHRALVKTHHASQTARGLPLFAELFTDRVLHIVRDPRDVLPSLADHMGLSLEDACTMLCDSSSSLSDRGEPEDTKMEHFTGSWSDHTGSWLRQDGVTCKTFRFEDLKEDTAGTFADMLRFLGEEDVNEERLEVAVDRTSLENMRSIEEDVGFHEASPHSDDGFFRTGETNKDIPEELRRKIEEEHGDVMEQLGYMRRE